MQEVTTTSWFERIKNAIGGVLFGVVLFLVAFPLLWWNEGRAVQVAEGLSQGKGAVVNVDPEKVDPANDGKLIQFTGMAVTEEMLEDPVFMIRENVLKLKREVLTYQWKEITSKKTTKKVGGGTETVTDYRYELGWHKGIINSRNFKEPKGHENPERALYEPQTFVANNITVGQYQLSPALVNSISNYQPYHVPDGAERDLPTRDLRDNVYAIDGIFYDGENIDDPLVGDTKISFDVVKPSTVSILAQQQGDQLVGYKTDAGTTIQRLSLGALSAEQMFEQAEQENTMMLWILRIVGLFMMFGGLMLVVNPMVVLADVVPFFGRIVGAGVGMFAFLIALGFSFITIAVAWVAVRPVLGIAMLIIGIGSVVAFFVLSKGKGKQTIATAPPGGAPQMSPGPDHDEFE
ncbi:MAG: TMEM43 family protein [Vulcanimicrobiota bacterium]